MMKKLAIPTREGMVDDHFGALVGGRNGTWHGQQGQSQIHEADARDYDQVPREERSHSM